MDLKLGQGTGIITPASLEKGIKIPRSTRTTGLSALEDQRFDRNHSSVRSESLSGTDLSFHPCILSYINLSTANIPQQDWERGAHSICLLIKRPDMYVQRRGIKQNSQAVDRVARH